MKKWAAFLFICYLTNSFSQTIISPQFSELKGIEDQQGNTHLFYRIYNAYSNDPFYEFNNDIYHCDLQALVDTLFLRDYIHEDPAFSSFRRISDYTFWNNDFTKYIYGGVHGTWEPLPFISRFDEPNIYLNYIFGEINQIDISNSDDSLLYAGGYLNGINTERTIFSLDGGFNWSPISDSLELLAIKPDYDQVLFSFNDNGYISNYNGGLYKSTNGGLNFYLVDTLKKYPSAENDEIIFDFNTHNIYRLFGTLYDNFVLRISLNNGEPFSWQTNYTSNSKIYISNDESVSGTIYLADNKNILVSTDYGDNFSLYETLDRKIVGIYNKPNSNKLYAATKYNIYEITPDTTTIVKALPIPEEVLNFYPLAIGNSWVFHHSTVTYDPYPNYSYQIDVKEVLGDTLAPNGKHYYKVKDQTIWESSVLERVDSSDGKVYRYFEDTTLTENEYVAYDLLAEVGDTVSSFRTGFNTVMFTTLYTETTFEKWGLIKPKKVFEEYTLHPPIFSLTQEIGLDSIYFYFDFGETYITLKGCLIDGVIYGDTTTVDVEDEENPIPISFKLEQNYPNPFNPSTKIQYAISSRQFVTLKVYDILGNEIATLVNEEKSAGEYEVKFNAVGTSRDLSLTSGIYFYQLKSGSFAETRKMVLLK